jgi:hypothetical protein
MNAAAGPAGCPTYSAADITTLRTQLGGLYVSSSSDYKTIDAMLLDIKTKMEFTKADKTVDAQGKAYEILRKLLPDWTSGKLKAGATTTKVQAFIDLLYRVVCLGTAPTLPTSGGGAGVITPAGGGTVLTSDKQAGVRFPAGAVTQNTTVTIAPTADSLNTMLDKYQPNYDFTATPHDPGTPFGADLTVGICQNASIDPTVFARLQLGHNIVDQYASPYRFGKIEILPKVSAEGLGLACSTLGGSASLSPVDRWKSFAAALVLPEPLHATSAALVNVTLGGSTRNLSPFGGVDPRVALSVNGGNNQSATVGTAVATPPSVKALTPLGRPVPGVPIAFAVTAGGGTISPTTNVLTLNDGVASATSWTLGPNAGTNTATGTGVNSPNCATNPSLPATCAVGTQGLSAQLKYTGSPVNFSATGTAVGTIEYLSTGYRYKLSTPEGTFPPADFEKTTFDDSGWSTGDAGFGHEGGFNCPLNGPSSNKTEWPAGTAEIPSYIIIRKQFTVAGTSAQVGVAIDNDVRVWVDGNELTATGGTLDGGFVTHEGCAAPGSLTFIANNLGSGPHLLVVEGRDRGGSSYLDVEVTPVSAPVLN